MMTMGSSRRNDKSTSQEGQTAMTDMFPFVPYIEGPKMDWTVNDGLYHRFLKWKLKCENILDCELASLSESRQCKKLISWSGDDGMDLVVSWGLNDRELTLETLWTNFEDFCKPQANEVRARFDLLTSFRQGDKSVDEWFNAVQTQINLCQYPPETANILQRDIFWFFLKDEEFVSKTLNEGCADLQQYPASKVRQLVKKLESSKATARHIKQATSNAQAAQINLLHHQRTELSQKKKKGHKWKQHFKSKDSKPPYKKRPHPSQAHGSQDCCSKCGDTRHAQGFSCPAKKYLCKACKKYGHFTSLCFSKQKKTAYQITAEEMENNSESEMDEDPYSDDSFVLYQMRAKINMSTTRRRVPKKTHLIANLPYRLKVHLVTARLSATSDKLQQIRQATQDDNTMALLKHTITYRWPQTVQELPKELQAYWTFREEMTVENGLILKATRITIPPSMRESTLQQLHEGHLGFTKCYHRAKQTVYWPNLRKELEDLVLNCQLCLKHSKAKRKPKPTPSFGQEIPVIPWTKLASDIFHFQNDSYLLIVDFTSRFPIVRKLKSMKAKHVGRHFSEVFGEYGWPDTLLTDNGPCYASHDFKQLMLDMSVNHITSSPHYPQSNGLAEKYVQIVKNLFIKAHEEGTDYQKALMIYRNTPLDDNLTSPMQILQGRTARSDLPMSYAAKVKFGLASGQPSLLRPEKNERSPTHD